MSIPVIAVSSCRRAFRRAAAVTANKSPISVSKEQNNYFSKMPYNNKNKAKSSSVSNPTGAPAPTTEFPISITKSGSLSITLLVRPGAKSNCITGISQEGISLQINAPPVDGQANEAIIKYFADVLQINKSFLSLKGGKSRTKTLFIESSTSIDSTRIHELIAGEIGK